MSLYGGNALLTRMLKLCLANCGDPVYAVAVDEDTKVAYETALTALFTAPLYGFAAPLSSEGKRGDGSFDTMAIEVPKAQKAFVYACAIVGALGAFLGLGSLFGGGMGMRLARWAIAP